MAENTVTGNLAKEKRKVKKTWETLIKVKYKQC